MWDVLFGPASQSVPDVFLTPYQDAPLDLDCPGVFYASRRKAIEARVTQIAGMTPHQIAEDLGRTWRAHYGQACRGMRWDTYPLQLLQLIAVGMGGPTLACLADALAADHKHLTGGMPDLLLWRVAAPIDASADIVPAAGGRPLFLEPDAWFPIDVHGPDVVHLLPPQAVVQVAFVEVKGPRDTLSEKQHLWLSILSAAGARSGLCKITEPKKGKGGGGGGAGAGGNGS
jgi:Fanconi-associated nuclease 1